MIITTTMAITTTTRKNTADSEIVRIELNPVEARVFGVLLEKEATTRDSYPLTLNAITVACNQKSSREPVMTLTDTEVQEALDRLYSATLVRRESVSGSRVERYGHRLTGRLDNELEFPPEQRAVLSVLLLRGPQTCGEIRTRAGRLHDFSDTAQVAGILTKLAHREGGPWVRELPRQLGRRESRYQELFSGADRSLSPVPADSGDTQSSVADGDDEPLRQRVDDLERRLSELEVALTELSKQLALKQADPPC